ncbi:MAG: class I adenylate-forming enzyme family protein, partial [Vicinamibacterales bacterium]
MIHADLLGERARLTPHKLALVDVATGTRLDYATLNARALRTARILRCGLRLEPGDRVALLAGNRLEYLDLVFATAKSGTVLVPLGTRLTAHELEHIVTDSGARVVIYDTDFRSTIAELATRVSDIRSWVGLDDPLPGHHRFDEPIGDAAALAWTPSPMDPESLYALLYTSGTTGRPKGVMIPHRMVSWNAYNTVACWQLREDDVSPIFTPLYHAGALAAFLTPIIAIGGTIVLHRAFEPAEVWQTIVGERCTVVLGVPT